MKVELILDAMPFAKVGILEYTGRNLLVYQGVLVEIGLISSMLFAGVWWFIGGMEVRQVWLRNCQYRL